MQLVKTDLLFNEKCRSKQYCLFPFQFSVLLICVGTIDSKSCIFDTKMFLKS
jgi:hypothetical protein